MCPVGPEFKLKIIIQQRLFLNLVLLDNRVLINTTTFEFSAIFLIFGKYHKNTLCFHHIQLKTAINEVLLMNST